jgi:TonB family protein
MRNGVLSQESGDGPTVAPEPDFFVLLVARPLGSRDQTVICGNIAELILKSPMEELDPSSMDHAQDRPDGPEDAAMFHPADGLEESEADVSHDAEPHGEELHAATAPQLSEEAQPSLASAARAHQATFRPSARRRFFGIPLAGGISWTTSILVHVIVIGSGYEVYRHFRPPAPPAPVLDFALGDASQTRSEIFWHEQTAGGSGLPNLSEIDPDHAPPDSATAIMRQLENNQTPDFPMSRLAPSYVGPHTLWLDAPPAGAQGSAKAQMGTLATPPAKAPPAATPGAAPVPAPAPTGQGDGTGKSEGSGRSNANSGRAGTLAGDSHANYPAPVYPEESIRRNEEGVVSLSVTVLQDGSVGEVSVASAPPFPRLTRSAIDAVRKRHFDLSMANTTVVVPYEIKLK